MESGGRGELDELVSFQITFTLNFTEKMIRVLFFISTILPLVSSCQDLNEETAADKQYAKQAIKDALSGKGHYVTDSLITDKKTAIAVAEPILFKVYGRENIIDQKPYKCYLIDGYWYISGTLPKGWRGGVFEIIINSKDGKVIKLIHGK